MLFLSILVTCLLHSAIATCPVGTLTYNGECVKSNLYSTCQNSYLYTNASAYCTAPTYPVIISKDMDQEYWTGIASKLAYIMVLGIRCNTSSSVWEWADGSRISYKPKFYSSDLTSTCVTNRGWFLSTNGTWTSTSGTGSSYCYLYCATKPTPIVPADSECGDFSDDEDDERCYQVGKTLETWTDAQNVCKSFGANLASIRNVQENSFIRRLAVSRGLINGVMLGGNVLGKGKPYSWIDGSDWDYTNFMNDFPADGAGNCIAMDTNNASGQWVNANCSARASFACVKTSQDKEPSCGADIRTAGEVIYSPGFPNNASVPCDFFLGVEEGRQVEVQVLFLEANSCCDRLVLTEGSIGGDVIANLTGEIANPVKYRTKASNVMRASWQPNGGHNVRGMMNDDPFMKGSLSTPLFNEEWIGVAHNERATRTLHFHPFTFASLMITFQSI